MSDDTKKDPCYFHVLKIRNPLGSKAHPRTVVDELQGAHNADITRDDERFDPKCLGEEVTRLEHLEAHIRQHGLGGVWRLDITTPFWNTTWERNAEGDWICIKAGMGD